MNTIMNFPLLVLVLSLAVLWFSAQIGVFCRRHLQRIDEDDRQDLSTVVAATLTLLGLIIAFSFSMAISRYDQRKNYEAEEANAIGTEYLRANLLSGADADRVHQLLQEYVRQRMLFYETRREPQLHQIDTDTTRLETELWSVVRDAAEKQPTPPMALVVSGMNDALNARAYTQAAWWNRIPVAAWILMASIAVFCNLLIGYGAHRTGVLLFFVLPLALSISFFLISDIDSPRGGVIRVLPKNLVSRSESLRAQ